MTQCTIYDKATGEILCSATVSDETLEHYVDGGHDALLDVQGDPAKQYVLNDALVDYTAAELAARAAMLPGQVWVLPDRVVKDMRVVLATADAAIATIDRLADAARLSVSPAGRDLEYSRAEAQARPYAAAGYPDPVPSCVASWAAAKRWTNGGTPWTGRQSADDIIKTADQWYAALDTIRDLRLNAKEQARSIAAAAGANADIDAVLAQFGNDLASLMLRLE